MSRHRKPGTSSSGKKVRPEDYHEYFYDVREEQIILGEEDELSSVNEGQSGCTNHDQNGAPKNGKTSQNSGGKARVSHWEVDEGPEFDILGLKPSWVRAQEMSKGFVKRSDIHCKLCRDKSPTTAKTMTCQGSSSTCKQGHTQTTEAGMVGQYTPTGSPQRNTMQNLQPQGPPPRGQAPMQRYEHEHQHQPSTSTQQSQIHQGSPTALQYQNQYGYPRKTHQVPSNYGPSSSVYQSRVHSASSQPTYNQDKQVVHSQRQNYHENVMTEKISVPSPPKKSENQEGTGQSPAMRSNKTKQQSVYSNSDYLEKLQQYEQYRYSDHERHSTSSRHTNSDPNQQSEISDKHQSVENDSDYNGKSSCQKAIAKQERIAIERVLDHRDSRRDADFANPPSYYSDQVKAARAYYLQQTKKAADYVKRTAKQLEGKDKDTRETAMLEAPPQNEQHTGENYINITSSTGPETNEVQYSYAKYQGQPIPMEYDIRHVGTSAHYYGVPQQYGQGSMYTATMSSKQYPQSSGYVRATQEPMTSSGAISAEQWHPYYRQQYPRHDSKLSPSTHTPEVEDISDGNVNEKLPTEKRYFPRKGPGTADYIGKYHYSKQDEEIQDSITAHQVERQYPIQQSNPQHGKVLVEPVANPGQYEYFAELGYVYCDTTKEDVIPILPPYRYMPSRDQQSESPRSGNNGGETGRESHSSWVTEYEILDTDVCEEKMDAECSSWTAETEAAVVLDDASVPEPTSNDYDTDIPMNTAGHNQHGISQFRASSGKTNDRRMAQNSEPSPVFQHTNHQETIVNGTNGEKYTSFEKQYEVCPPSTSSKVTEKDVTAMAKTSSIIGETYLSHGNNMATVTLAQSIVEEVISNVTKQILLEQNRGNKAETLFEGNSIIPSCQQDRISESLQPEGESSYQSLRKPHDSEVRKNVSASPNKGTPGYYQGVDLLGNIVVSKSDIEVEKFSSPYRSNTEVEPEFLSPNQSRSNIAAQFLSPYHSNTDVEVEFLSPNQSRSNLISQFLSPHQSTSDLVIKSAALTDKAVSSNASDSMHTASTSGSTEHIFGQVQNSCQYKPAAFSKSENDVDGFEFSSPYDSNTDVEMQFMSPKQSGSNVALEFLSPQQSDSNLNILSEQNYSGTKHHEVSNSDLRLDLSSINGSSPEAYDELLQMQAAAVAETDHRKTSDKTNSDKFISPHKQYPLYFPMVPFDNELYDNCKVDGRAPGALRKTENEDHAMIMQQNGIISKSENDIDSFGFTSPYNSNTDIESQFLSPNQSRSKLAAEFLSPNQSRSNVVSQFLSPQQSTSDFMQKSPDLIETDTLSKASDSMHTASTSGSAVRQREYIIGTTDPNSAGREYKEQFKSDFDVDFGSPSGSPETNKHFSQNQATEADKSDMRTFYDSFQEHGETCKGKLICEPVLKPLYFQAACDDSTCYNHTGENMIMKSTDDGRIQYERAENVYSEYKQISPRITKMDTDDHHGYYTSTIKIDPIPHIVSSSDSNKEMDQDDRKHLMTPGAIQAGHKTTCSVSENFSKDSRTHFTTETTVKPTAHAIETNQKDDKDRHTQDRKTSVYFHKVSEGLNANREEHDEKYKKAIEIHSKKYFSSIKTEPGDKIPIQCQNYMEKPALDNTEPRVTQYSVDTSAYEEVHDESTVLTCFATDQLIRPFTDASNMNEEHSNEVFVSNAGTERLEHHDLSQMNDQDYLRGYYSNRSDSSSGSAQYSAGIEARPQYTQAPREEISTDAKMDKFMEMWEQERMELVERQRALTDSFNGPQEDIHFDEHDTTTCSNGSKKYSLSVNDPSAQQSQYSEQRVIEKAVGGYEEKVVIKTDDTARKYSYSCKTGDGIRQTDYTIQDSEENTSSRGTDVMTNTELDVQNAATSVCNMLSKSCKYEKTINKVHLQDYEAVMNALAHVKGPSSDGESTNAANHPETNGVIEEDNVKKYTFICLTDVGTNTEPPASTGNGYNPPSDVRSVSTSMQSLSVSDQGVQVFQKPLRAARKRGISRGIQVKIDNDKVPLSPSPPPPPSSDVIVDERTRHHAVVGEYLLKLYTKDQLSDTIVHVGNYTFSAHSVMLACHCKLLTRELLKDRTVALQRHMTLPSGIIPCAFETLLEYMYSGELNVDQENVVELLSAASVLQMKPVEEKCRDVLRQLGSDSILLVWQTATRFNLKCIADEALTGAALAFPKMVESRDFLLLPLDKVCTLLSCDDLCIESELEVVEAGIKWVEYQSKDRALFVPQVMSCVRFSTMCREELLQAANMAEFILSESSVLSMIIKANWYVCSEEAGLPSGLDISVPLTRTPPKRPDDRQKSPKKFGSPYRRKLFTTEVLSPKKPDEGECLSSTSRSTFEEVSHNQSYYEEIKAHLPHQQEDSISVVTPTEACAVAESSTSWSTFEEVSHNQSYYEEIKAHLPHQQEDSISVVTPTEACAVAEVSSLPFTPTDGSSIPLIQTEEGTTHESTQGDNAESIVSVHHEPERYVLLVGGYCQEEGRCEGILLLNLEDGRWERMAMLPEPRVHHTSVIIGDDIYLIGGCDPVSTGDGHRVPTSWVSRYDTVSHVWFTLAPLNTPRKHHCACTYGGAIYVIGGQDENQRVLSSVERYDPAHDVWEHVGDMMTGRMGAAAAVYEDSIIVSGGCGMCLHLHGEYGILDSVERLDIHENRWQLCAPLRMPRCYASLVPSGERLYLIGGLSPSLTSLYPVCISLAAIDSYDPYANTWQHVTELSVPRHHAAASALDGHLFVVGGVSTLTGTPMSIVECYILDQDAWNVMVPDLSTATMGAQCVNL